MPMVTMRQLLDEAAKGGYGVGAFNVNNMEQIQAHVCDTIGNARKALHEQSEFFKNKLKELKEQK